MLVYSQYINIRARRFRSKIKRHKTERKLISLFFIFQPSEVLVFTITTHKLCANIGIRSVTFKTKNAKYESCLPFYRTRVRSLVMLVTHSLTNWLTHSLLFSKLDWCDVCLVKMPTQNLLRLLLLLMLMMRNVHDSCMQICKLKFGHEAKFCSDFELKVWSRVWSWNSSKILKLKFGQNFAAEPWWGYEVVVWSRFWSLVEMLRLGWDFGFWNLIEICVRTCYW